MNGISVVICCYNSALKLPETLLHLVNQQTSDGLSFEIILIDNGSTDNTASLATAFWQTLCSSIPFKISIETRLGKNYAIEKGILESNFNLVLFCDDDNLLEPNYLQLGFDYFRAHPNLGLLGGKGFPRFTTDVLPEWFERYAYQYAVGAQTSHTKDITHDAGFVYGAGSILKKTAYEHLKAKGFEYTVSGRIYGQIMAGEDNELGYALSLIGYQIHYYDALHFIHVIPTSRLEWSYAKNLKKRVAYSNILLSPYRYYRNKTLLHTAASFSWNKTVLVTCFYIFSNCMRYFFSTKTFQKDIALDTQSRLGRLQALFQHRSYLIHKNRWLTWLSK